MRVMTTLLVVCAALYGSSNAGVASVERPPSPRPWWTGQLDAPRFSGRDGFPSPAAPFQTVDLKVDGYGFSKVDGDSPGQAPARPRPAAAECAGTAMLGLDADTLTAAARTRLSVPGDVTGVVVTHVFADGPAARAGLQVGDLLVAVDGTPVSDACALTLVAFTRRGLRRRARDGMAGGTVADADHRTGGRDVRCSRSVAAAGIPTRASDRPG